MEQLISHSAVGILLNVGKYIQDILTCPSYYLIVPQCCHYCIPFSCLWYPLHMSCRVWLYTKENFTTSVLMMAICENWLKISTMPRSKSRRMSVEMDKVSMNAQWIGQGRVSVETENPSLGKYLHRRRWSSDSIHHLSEALHLSFHWKRRTTLPVVTLGTEGEVTPPPHHHEHGHIHKSIIHFTRTVSATLRKRKNPIPALAVVVLEDGVVELVRILLEVRFHLFCNLF